MIGEKYIKKKITDTKICVGYILNYVNKIVYYNKSKRVNNVSHELRVSN